MKLIKYIPKSTSANTEYREIDPQDLDWIKMELLRYLAVMSERDIRPSTDTDNQWVLQQFWHRRTNKLHKGRWQEHYRENTPCSFIGGLVNNLVFGTQRDLSSKQMEDLEFVSICMNSIYPEIESMRFQIGFQS